QTKAAAQSLGVEIHVVEVQGPDRFESAFAAVAAAHAGALIVLGDGMLYSQQPRIVTYSVGSTARTSPSNTDGQRDDRNECASWQRNWSGSRSISSSHRVPSTLRRPSERPRRYPSSS